MSLQAYLSTHPAYATPITDDSPLPALYADLSAQRTSNPAAFGTNVAWWGGMLAEAALAGVLSGGGGGGKDRLVLHMRKESAEEWENEEVGRPLGLGTAVLELARTEALLPLSTFLAASQPVVANANATSNNSGGGGGSTMSNVARTAVEAPLRWLFAQLSLGGGGGDAGVGGNSEVHDKKAMGDWVVLRNVEKAATALLAAHYAKPRLSPLDSLYSHSMFKRELLSGFKTKQEGGKEVELSELDTKVLLKYLARDAKVAQVSGDVIKLAHTRGEVVPGITEQDRRVVELRCTHAKLEDQVADIESRIAERQTRIESSLRAKQKPQALSYLRSRKQLEELLTRRMGALETLHGVLVKLEQAAGDVEIMRAYELSTQTIRQLLAHPSLQRERVDETMEDLASTLADHSEIAEAVQIGGQVAVGAAGGAEDEEELREELETLERETREEERIKKEKMEEGQVEVPSPPETLPAAPVKTRPQPQQQQRTSEAKQQAPVAEH